MEHKFYIGQKVVCINDDINAFIIPNLTYRMDGPWDLELNKIYTIRGIVISTVDNAVLLHLHEIKRDFDHVLKFEVGFNAYRFKPVETKKTDISIFTGMLNSVKQNEKV